MLSCIWVSVRITISRVARFWISGMAAQRGGSGFRDTTLAVNQPCSFIMGLFTGLADFRRATARGFVALAIFYDLRLWRFGHIGESQSDPLPRQC